MMDCRSLRDDLKAYVDGELPRWRHAVVRRHLADCAGCREEAAAMEEMGHELRAGDAGEMSAALRSRILAEIPAGTPQADQAPPTPRPLWRQPLALWGAAATILLVCCVLWPALYRADHIDRPAMRVASAPTAIARMSARNPSSAGELPPATDYGPLAAGSAPAAPGGAAGLSAEAAAQGYDDGHAKELAKAQAGPAPGLARGLPAAATRSVHKEATITVEVADIEENSASIEQMTRDAGGFVERNSLSTGPEGLRTASLALRIPTGRFEETLKRLARLGSVASKGVKGEDMTDQVTDERQAAGSLQQSVQDAERKVRQAGRTPDDDMAVAEMRVRLAQARGRLENLQKLTALSSIAVELREKSKTRVNGGGFIDEMGDTGRSAVNSFLGAARIPVLALIWVLAYSPLWVPLAIGYRYAARAQKQRAAAREAREWKMKRSEGAAV